MAARDILVTGATRGIGRALVEELIGLGHRLAGCGRDTDAIAQLRRLGEEHFFETVDVADDAAVAIWASALEEAGFLPDLLVNNAALINQPAPLWQVSAQEMDGVIDVNLKGIANCVRHFLPRMIAGKRGVVVNFSSGWGRSTSAGMAPYCTTKWGVEGMTRALAQDLPPGVAAVSFSPGTVATEMLAIAFGPEAAAQSIAPGEWALAAAPFLLALDGRDNGAALDSPGS